MVGHDRDFAAIKKDALSDDHNPSFLRLWTDGGAGLRHAMRIGFVLAAVTQLTGINAVMCFSVTILTEAAGVDSKATALLLGASTGILLVLGKLVSLRWIDSYGRRPLFLWSLALQGLSCCGVAVCAGLLSFGTNQKIGILVFMGFYLVAFGVGGPVPGVVTGEIFPVRVRAVCNAQVIIIGSLCSLLVTATFLSIMDSKNHSMGDVGERGSNSRVGLAIAFSIFAVIAFGGWVWLWRHLPETKNRTLEDMADEVRRADARAEGTGGPRKRGIEKGGCGVQKEGDVGPRKAGGCGTEKGGSCGTEKGGCEDRRD